MAGGSAVVDHHDHMDTLITHRLRAHPHRLVELDPFDAPPAVAEREGRVEPDAQASYGCVDWYVYRKGSAGSTEGMRPKPFQ
jgi:hypothetical protein